ncbi:hypothetical protein [Helicobacter sp. 13S00482-2]|nr:hypothetical protein [Helicobacter sp. 13S00482-2]
MAYIPFGVALALGHSSVELGGLFIAQGTQDDDSIKTNYAMALEVITLSY